MPPHKSKFRWRTSKRTFERDASGVGGILYEERACSRGGIFVAKLIYTAAISQDLVVSGRWVLEYPDGRVHSQGDHEEWGAPMPSTLDLEWMASNPPAPFVTTEWIEGSETEPIVREFLTPEDAGEFWKICRAVMVSDLEPAERMKWRFKVEDRLARRSKTFTFADR